MTPMVVVGSSNTDLVIESPRLPSPGETLLGGEFSRHAGGKGANQAVAAARAGADVVFVGARGDDDFGKAARDGLKREGVDVRFFRVCRTLPSGVALILLGGKTKENQIVVAKSANDGLKPADVRAANVAFRNAGAVVVQLEIPMSVVMESGRMAKQAGIPFILNPAPARPLSSGLLKMVHTLIPNEHEAALLGGVGDPGKAAEVLRRRGCGNVVITLGAKGALVVTRDGKTLVPAPRVKPVDTVGAGDCFTAWLSVGVAEGRSLVEAAQRAVKAASIAVTRRGAQSGMPFAREV